MTIILWPARIETECTETAAPLCFRPALSPPRPPPALAPDSAHPSSLLALPAPAVCCCLLLSTPACSCLACSSLLGLAGLRAAMAGCGAGLDDDDLAEILGTNHQAGLGRAAFGAVARRWWLVAGGGWRWWEQCTCPPLGGGGTHAGGCGRWLRFPVPSRDQHPTQPPPPSPLLTSSCRAAAAIIADFVGAGLFDGDALTAAAAAAAAGGGGEVAGGRRDGHGRAKRRGVKPPSCVGPPPRCRPPNRCRWCGRSPFWGI